MILNLNKYNIFIAGIIIRLSIFLFFIFFPIEHLKYGILSPFSFQYFADMNFYYKFFNLLDLDSEYTKNIINTYFNIITLNFSESFNSNIVNNITNNRFPGPFFPFILYITSYTSDFTFALSILVITTEIITLYFWLSYFVKKINSYYLLLFVLMPFPMVLSFLHSSDVFFYFFSSIIFLMFIGEIKLNKKIFFILLLINCSIRPAAISILISIIFYCFVLKKNNKFYFIYSSLFILIIATFYYIPYFFVENSIVNKLELVTNLSNKISFNNYILSGLSFYFIKFIYLFGFHPTSSGNQLIFLIRALSAIYLIVGYLYSIKNIKKFDSWYLNFYIIPIIFLLYPTWRYILPISPILFLNFIYFFDSMKNILFKKK